MERRSQDVLLPDRDDSAVVEARQDVDVGPGPLDDRRPDEHAVNRLVAEDRNLQVRFEGVELAAERVARDTDVQERQHRSLIAFDLAREDDHPGARPKQRGPASCQVEDRLAQAPALDQPSDGRAFAAGQDQPADARELLGTPYLHSLDADGAKGVEVFPEVALKGKNADLHSRRPPGCGDRTTNRERPGPPLRGALPGRWLASGRPGPCLPPR